MKPETGSDATIDWPEPQTELGRELIALAKEIDASGIPKLTLDEIEEYLGRERDCDSFEELVEPISQSFDESGMTEEELDALIEHERQIIGEEKPRREE